jgi:hypothetical protein
MCPSGMATVVASCYPAVNLVGPRVKHSAVGQTRQGDSEAQCQRLVL